MRSIRNIASRALTARRGFATASAKRIGSVMVTRKVTTIPHIVVFSVPQLRVVLIFRLSLYLAVRVVLSFVHSVSNCIFRLKFGHQNVKLDQIECGADFVAPFFLFQIPKAALEKISAECDIKHHWDSEEAMPRDKFLKWFELPKI
jgi:hypothetical protein